MSKIQVKNVEVLGALLNRNIDPMLMEIILWVAENHGLCFTEGWREPRHPGDVHSTQPLRAVDLRSWFYEAGIDHYIEGEINRRWQYDPERPEKQCAWIHDSGSGAHFHLQCHPRTVRK